MSAPSTLKRRVVITGLGTVNPLGKTVSETWAAAIEGRSGIRTISLFPTEGCPVTFAGEVVGFDPAKTYGPFFPIPGGEAISAISSPKDVRRLGRFIQLALAAGLEAYGDSGLDAHRASIAADRIGINIGVGMGGMPEIESTHTDLTSKGYRRISPFFIPGVIANLASGQLSLLLHTQGPNLCSVSACASSAHSVGESTRAIQYGDVDIMLAGGAEAVVSPLGIGGFAAMKALSTRNDEPQKASRPFDTNRDGFVMGEGAAVLVLEEREHALRRGARIYAEVVGYGSTADAYHMTTPAPGGEGGLRAMRKALAEAGIRPEQIGYVNAHATSTPAGDTEEARAIATLLGDARKQVHVSATKSMTGHLLGAAGALEALLCVKALETSILPPTINLDQLDPACAELGMDFTAHRAVSKKMTHALSNSFGFGGTNVSLILAR